MEEVMTRKIVASDGGAVMIGRQSDNETLVVAFPIADYIATIGDGGTWAIRFEPPNGAGAYPIAQSHTQKDGDYLYWEITDTEVSASGRGAAQLSYTIGGRVMMTQVWTVIVGASLGEGSVPEPWEAYLDEAEEHARDAVSAASAAQQASSDASGYASSAAESARQASAAVEEKFSALTADAEEVPSTADAFAEYDAERNKMHFGIPRVGSDKMDKENPTGTGAFSLNRRYGSSVGYRSTAEGDNCSAQGDYSHAEGEFTNAVGSYTHAEGRSTNAGKAYSWAVHAEGYQCTANGDFGAHAEGQRTSASAYAVHAEGYESEASGHYCHAEGESAVADAKASHAEGIYTYAHGEGAHAEGVGTAADRVSASARGAHAEGMQTKADANASHAEGYMSEAHANASHAECNRAKVYSENGHAEGFNCEVGSPSDTTKSMANSGHAEGRETKALGYASHSEGRGTIAGGAEQHVQGRFNVRDSTSAFIIGNGTDDAHRSNALKVGFDGTLTIGGVSITPAQLQALLNLL